MSVENLAARLDTLDAGEAFVTEGDVSVTVSNVPTGDAQDIARRCAELGWGARVEDRENNTWAAEELEDEYAPFTVIINKPAAPAGVLRLLTNVGMGQWLDREDDRRIWQIGRLGQPFRTYAVTFNPWNVAALGPDADEQDRSARRLVREAVAIRQVPASMGRWLLADRIAFPEGDEAADNWAGIAVRKLMLALPDELDGLHLRFKGPPKLDLELPRAGTEVLRDLTNKGFAELQEAVDWVFEIEREAEMRHILLATEIARSGGKDDTAVAFVRANIADALASAKTAYQVQLAGMSSDALKTLSELRKSVSDDTAKVAEGTRQIVTAVFGALAVCIGLVATRLSGTVSPPIVSVVLLLAATYVAITVVSGVLFTLLQRKVRKAWKPRLYRFLSKADYDALVGGPALTAEVALWISSALGVLAIMLMLHAVGGNPRANNEAPRSEIQANTASTTKEVSGIPAEKAQTRPDPGGHSVPSAEVRVTSRQAPREVNGQVLKQD